MARFFATIEVQTYCYEEGLSGWEVHKTRRFKNRKAAQAAVDAMNRRADPYTSYRLQPEVS